MLGISIEAHAHGSTNTSLWWWDKLNIYWAGRILDSFSLPLLVGIWNYLDGLFLINHSINFMISWSLINSFVISLLSNFELIQHFTFECYHWLPSILWSYYCHVSKGWNVGSSKEWSKKCHAILYVCWNTSYSGHWW